MALFLAFALSTLRPVNLPSSENFQSSSTLHRVILGSAGIEIFKGNPVFGVGWSNSSEPAVIGDPAISDSLRRRFDRARPGFFPDINPSNVHNVYVQIAAETGVAGFVTFAVALLTIRLRCRRLLAGLPVPLVYPAGETRALAATLMQLAALAQSELAAVGSSLRERVESAHSLEGWADTILASIRALT